MNRRQQERVEELGNAFQGELRRIFEMDEVNPRMTQVDYQETEACPSPELDYSHTQKNIAPFNVTIRQQHNGFIVEVGCQTFVFETYDKMAKYLKMYFEDPKGMITKHEEGTLFE